MDNRVPVVVVYRGGNGALAIARTLGRLGVPVYLVSKKGASPIQESRFWTERFWWDFSAPADTSLQFLVDVSRRIGERPILLTLADWVAIFIEENASALREHYVFPHTPRPVVRMLADKWQMFLLAKKYRIPTPETAYPQTQHDVEEFLERTAFPVVVKSADPFLPHAPPNEIVHDSSDLLEKYDRYAAIGAPNLILQEYIPGDAESVWMCNAYFGRGSECRAIFTGKKLRQVSSTGIASLGICLPNETVAEQTRHLMEAVEYEGALDIGYRYDARDGLYKLLDVNPRVGGVFRLFRATNGMDVVRVCYLDLTGQTVPACSPSVGRKWILEDDFFSALSAARKGKLTFKQWVKSLRGIRETHWFAVDDPVPGLIWLWTQLWSRLSSRIRRMALTKAESPLSSSGA